MNNIVQRYWRRNERRQRRVRAIVAAASGVECGVFVGLRAAVGACSHMGQQIAGLVVGQQARREEWQQRLIGGAVGRWYRAVHRRLPLDGSRIGRGWGWLGA